MPPIKKVPTQVSKPVGGYSVKRLQADHYLAVDKADLEEMISLLVDYCLDVPCETGDAERDLSIFCLWASELQGLSEKIRFKRALLAGR